MKAKPLRRLDYLSSSDAAERLLQTFRPGGRLNDYPEPEVYAFACSTECKILPPQSPMFVTVPSRKSIIASSSVVSRLPVVFGGEFYIKEAFFQSRTAMAIVTFPLRKISKLNLHSL